MNTSVIDLSRVSDRRDAHAPQSESTALVAVIERAARDPSIDIDKMERLLVMQEKIFARNAEAEFNAAMSACQAEMPRIAPKTPNEQTGALYAALDEIDVIARPIYTRHGFALSFGTADSPIKDWYRQTCKVSHRAGHSEMRFADLPPDMAGIKGNQNKTPIQGFVSSMTYGQRCITKLIFNIVIGGEDSDGNGATLDADQIKAIEQKMAETHTDKAQFLGFWRVQSLEKMPAFNFPVIMEMLQRKACRIDPRGDTSNVPDPLRDKWVSSIADTLNQDKEEHVIAAELQEIAAELNKFPELYIRVLDEVARKKIITKANWKKVTAMLVDRNNHQ